MTRLLERDEPAPNAARSPTPDDGFAARERGRKAQEAVALVDRTMHVAGLLLRAGSYGLLAWLASLSAVGPHLLAGGPFGDFVAFAVLAARTWQWAPRATAAEAALFTLLFLWWWSDYSWPDDSGRALFALAAFGVLSSRLTVERRRLLGHDSPYWD